MMNEINCMYLCVVFFYKRFEAFSQFDIYDKYDIYI